MKTKERIKEEIGLYKLLMTIFAAIASSVGGWIFSNFNYAVAGDLILALLSEIFFLTIVCILFFVINTKIEDLDYA